MTCPFRAASGAGELILFLDFDGVLHSDWGRPPVLFSQLPLLEQVLREHSHVNIVLSTSWRETDPLDVLREPFSEDIRARVIGATPVLNPITRARYSHTLSRAERQSECEAWLVEHRTPAHPWIAIDDRHWWFEPDCTRLFITAQKTGLIEAQLPELRVLIKRNTHPKERKA
jgi:hypothetical protein